MCHGDRKLSVTVQMMEEAPGITLQKEVSNHLKRLLSKAWVVSVKEKALLKVSGED